MKTNQKRLASLVSIILILAFALMMTGCGSGGAARVVSSVFDSIDKHNVTKFLNCFEDDKVELLLDEIDKDVLKEDLAILDEQLTDEYGKNWRKKVKVGKAEEIDKDDDITYYEVEISFEDEETTIGVIKVKGKYYIEMTPWYFMMF